LGWHNVRATKARTSFATAVARFVTRALILSGDSARARSAYQEFLTLWNDADRDIPILKQAEAGYAKI
jgi:hypothetical protein